MVFFCVLGITGKIGRVAKRYHAMPLIPSELIDHVRQLAANYLLVRQICWRDENVNETDIFSSMEDR